MLPTTPRGYATLKHNINRQRFGVIALRVYIAFCILTLLIAIGISTYANYIIFN